MNKNPRVRQCGRFRCKLRNSYRCCADCNERDRVRCPDPCQNHPSRCGLAVQEARR